MKINIITRHYPHNYGAMLQAWALMTTLKNEGADCKILNYRPQKNTLISHGSYVRTAINGVMTAVNYKSIKKGFNCFEDFIDNEYDLTKEYNKYSELQSLEEKPDAYIVGSDQVWNPNALRKEYFLDFADDKALKVSYAASMGVNKLPESCIDSYKTYLESFDAISVREPSAKEELDKLNLGKEVNVNIDPVFLVSEEEWSGFQKRYEIESGYILVYILYRPKWINEYLKELHNRTGKRIVVMSPNPVHTTYGNKYIHDAGPRELLWLIKHADCIISSSFHGVALSIANHRPFYAVVNPDMPSRISNILNIFGLEDRIIIENKAIDFCEIDYDSVEKIRLEERKKAIAYLNNALKTEKEEPPKAETIEAIGIKCTGCGVCELICPKNAIKMVTNEEGFKYPEIDNEKCVKCGLCVSKCHTASYKESGYDVKIYYGKSIDENVRYKSTSGGAFTAFAEPILKNGGLVIGAVFDKGMKKVRHRSSDNASLDDIRRSKYVESDLDNTFNEVKTALLKGRQVLFCGTPCQAAGLKRFIGENDNLIICDFLCHGVPSAKVFCDYIGWLEKNKEDEIEDYRFRTKTFGWSQGGLQIDYKRSGVIDTVGRCEFYYASGMIDDLFFRKSCYMCEKAIKHESDLTIGDFWGVFKYDSSLNDNKGISVVMTNTKKGEKLLENTEKEFKAHKIPADAIDYALKPKKNIDKLKKRNFMFSEYNRLGISEFINKYYSKRLIVNRVKFMITKLRIKKFN